MRVLSDTFGDRKFSEAKTRLCIPSFDGLHGEVHIFKTPHHPDFRKDTKERMTKVAAATSAAPTFFRPLEDGGYKFVDGGVWANNPIMIALVDALSCFSIPRKRIRILSLGCGDDGYTVGRLKMLLGGILAWHDVFSAAMSFQSLNALGQAGLLIGADRIVRVTPTLKKKIELDDWTRSVAELPHVAEGELDKIGETVASVFLEKPVDPYQPIITEYS